MNSKKLLFFILALTGLNTTGFLVGCTGGTPSLRSTETGKPATPRIPTVNGPSVEVKNPPPAVKLDNGAEVALQKYQGKLFFPVEATFSEQSFLRLQAALARKSKADRAEIIEKETQKILQTVRTVGAMDFTIHSVVGYFTFLLPYHADLMSPLKTLNFDHDLIFNPVIADKQSLIDAKSLTPATEGLVPTGSSRGGFEKFSGLARIHAPEFVALAESDIGSGVKVNGDSVNLGITDTGITLNHPTFMSLDKTKNRITYMKDFTREGRIYIHPDAKFEAKPAPGGLSNELLISAQIIGTPKLPSLPAGDQFAEVANIAIKASPELKALLLDPKQKFKLGYLDEDILSSEAEQADLNGNGKTNDKIPVLALLNADATLDQIYVDIDAKGDFQNLTPLGDWNLTKQTVDAFAEKIGFHIQQDKLASAAGDAEIAVHSISIVGFDPGNHGSHVAGIAAGSKTIANDSDLTLARGVAPEARIQLNRVCSNNAGCNATEAAIDLATNAKANLVNMSLGGLSPFNDGFGVEETVLNRLTSLNNVLFIISAGNSGPGKQTIGSPSTAKMSLSVGASASLGMIQRQYEWPAGNLVKTPEEDQDFMLFFSSRGPTAAGGFKPNLVAPGTELSSVQLNSAPGSRSGLDVYWGTSMAAPTASGAFALFLDGVHKYNQAHPDQALSEDVTVLRRVLIESAKPFDVKSFDPETGAETKGQYTWIDEGTGMLDLVAAWKKLIQLRDTNPPAAVSSHGKPVDLDYQVVIPTKMSGGNAYDGSRPSPTDPTFGTGLYINFYSNETLRPVYITRSLPFSLAANAEIGTLTRDLETTADEFVIKTIIYGSSKNWIKAGVLDQLGGSGTNDCASLEKGNTTLIGRGVDIKTKEDGTSTLSPFPASVLNVCIDRNMIKTELSPGDHGALIMAYRVAGGKVAAVPSFWVPVYLEVPHKTLEGSTAYEVQGKVKSFGVDRNYVTVPRGTSLLRVTLEVPVLKKASNGVVLPSEHCSGVELMALQGNNTDNPFPRRLDARISNCDGQGNADDGNVTRKITLTRSNPNPGTWDLHIFGQYRFAKSNYTLKVDYLTAKASVDAISGPIAFKDGSFDWNVIEASLAVAPDSTKSIYELDGLQSETASVVVKGGSVIVESPLGMMRKYPEATKSVTITIGGSSGNDIDLLIFECNAGSLNTSDPSCHPVAKSGGATDEETATFTPTSNKVYAVRVDGFDIHEAGANTGKFVSKEVLSLNTEHGQIEVSGQTPQFTVKYSLSTEQVSASVILNTELFTTGKMKAKGNLTLRSKEETVLFALPLLLGK